MSQENVEIARDHYDAFNRGDLDGLMETVAPDAEFANRIFGDTYRGREEIRTMFKGLWEVVENYTVEPDEFIATGERLVVVLRVGGRFRHTGIQEGISPGQLQMAHVLTFRHGQIVRNDICRDLAQAREAAGLRE
jgi:ketosteroid isomerase-like protein